jgi:hypothetical protein
MTILELARAVEVHPDFLRHIERGRVSPVPAKALVALADRLGCWRTASDPARRLA